MPESTVHVVMRDATIVLSDFGGVHTLSLPYVNGDLKWTPGGYSISHVRPRGIIQSPPMVRRDEDQETTLSVSATLTDLSDAAYATLNAILHESGYVDTTWVSTLGANADAFCVKMVVSIVKNGETHSVTFAHVHLTGEVSLASPGTISATGTDYEAFPALV